MRSLGSRSKKPARASSQPVTEVRKEGSSKRSSSVMGTAVTWGATATPESLSLRLWSRTSRQTLSPGSA